MLNRERLLACFLFVALSATGAGSAAAGAGVPSRNIAGPGDYALREQIVYRLSRDPDLAQERFSIVLVNGGAFFSGPISSCTARLRVLRTAGFVRGIINLHDEFVVERADVSDEALRDAVTAALVDTSEEIGLEDLQVEVADAVATLHGSVKRFPDRYRAEEIAGTVLGVTRIENRLRSRDVPVPAKHKSLADAVAAYLLDFRAFPHLGEFEVAAEDGVVTLDGRVTYYFTRRQAEVMTGLIEGVERVDNRVRVDPSLNLARANVRVRR